MQDVSRRAVQKTWRGRRAAVSVLAEMALRQEKVAERLAILRERQALTQEQAAAKVGVTLRQWQRWEAGQSMPYPRNLELIASRFGFSVADFFDAEPDLGANGQSQLERIEAKLDLLLAALATPRVAGDRAVAELLAPPAPPQTSRPPKRGTTGPDDHRDKKGR
jgi:transcriptional regulator with XRE-family HTH domain